MNFYELYVFLGYLVEFSFNCLELAFCSKLNKFIIAK